MANPTPRPILPYLEADPTIEARFWEKVKRGAPDQCWDWQASTAIKSYGRFKIASHESRHANRVAWTIANDREPGDLLIRHTCDRPACCNPAHLEVGTHADNCNDKMQRGRWRGGDQTGAKNGHAMLTVEQVGLIVTRIRSGWNNMAIARDLPVGHSLVSRIRTGRSWQREAAQFGWQPAIAYLERTKVAA